MHVANPRNPVPAMGLSYWLSKQNNKRKSLYGLSQGQKPHELGDVNLLLEFTTLLAEMLFFLLQAKDAVCLQCNGMPLACS